MKVIAKIVVAHPRCSLRQKSQLTLSAYIKYLSSYQSWAVCSFATFFISAASLVEISVIAYRPSVKKFVWVSIFIGVGGGGGGTSFTANKVCTNSI